MRFQVLWSVLTATCLAEVHERVVDLTPDEPPQPENVPDEIPAEPEVCAVTAFNVHEISV